MITGTTFIKRFAVRKPAHRDAARPSYLAHATYNLHGGARFAETEKLTIIAEYVEAETGKGVDTLRN